MDIQKKDVVVILLCALGGFLLVLSATLRLFVAITAGTVSGAGGGCVACIFERLLRSFERLLRSRSGEQLPEKDAAGEK